MSLSAKGVCFAAMLTADGLPALARVRDVPGIDVWVSPDGDIWVRGGEPIRALPHNTFGTLDEALRITPHGRQLPTRRLPADATWTPVADFLGVRLPGTVFPGQVVEPAVPIQLVRSAAWQPPALLRTNIAALRDFAENATRHVLSRLRFAMNEFGDVLVQGNPLPPLPGISYTLTNGLAVPCGWTWAPALPATIVAEAFGLNAEDIVLLEPTTDKALSVERIAIHNWMNATRSAIRLSHEPGLELDG